MMTVTVQHRIEVAVDSSVKPYPEVRARYSVLDAVDWRALTEGARRADVVVSHVGAWWRQLNEQLRLLLDRGGAVRLFVPDPGSVDAVRRIGTRSQTEDAQRQIHDIVREFQEARKVADSARIELVFLRAAPGYTAVRVDERLLLLAIVQRHKPEAPSILLDIEQSEHLRKFWQREFTNLRAQSRAGTAF